MGVLQIRQSHVTHVLMSWIGEQSVCEYFLMIWGCTDMSEQLIITIWILFK